MKILALTLAVLALGCESTDENPLFAGGVLGDTSTRTEPEQPDLGTPGRDSTVRPPRSTRTHVLVPAHVAEMPGANGEIVVDLFVDKTEMNNAEARLYDDLGWLWPGHDDDPALTTLRGARILANGRSIREGREPCYVPHDGGSLIPAIDCDGWRLPTLEEHAALVGDALVRRPMAPIDESIAGCYQELESRGICYDCTCPSGPRPVGHSGQNSLGLQDVVGNVAEWIESPAVDFRRYPDHGIAAGGSWSDDYWVLTDGQSWFRSNHQAPTETYAGLRLVRVR